MDIDHEQTLSQAEYVQAAKPLGFDATDDAWAGLCARFGDKTSKERPKTAEEVKDTALDLKLLGAYFQNRYDSLLEELLRRLLKGIVYTSKRSRSSTGGSRSPRTPSTPPSSRRSASARPRSRRRPPVVAPVHVRRRRVFVPWWAEGAAGADAELSHMWAGGPT